jgi:CTP:molybdopterin cytidylyltransferase MocA
MGCLLKQGGGLHPRLRIGAVLLAAAGGENAGGLPASLLRLQGVSLIRRQLVALSGAGVDEVVIVTGAARAAVEDEIRPFSVRVAHDPQHGHPREASIRVGLARLEGPFDAVFILPGELALVGAGDLIELIGAFKKRPAGHAVVPMVDARAGDLLVLDADAQQEMLEGRLDDGSVHRHETGNTRFLTRLDTRDDLEGLARRTGWRIEWPAMEVAF